MIYTAIVTFYLAEEQLINSPSWKDGIDEVTETALRIYGCDLIQESGILLRLPQAVMATSQLVVFGLHQNSKKPEKSKAARRFQVPLPENPPWWKAFDADKADIDEVCRVLAHLYSLPKAQCIPVCKKGGSFATSNRSWDSPSLPVSKEGLLDVPPVDEDTEEVAKDTVTKAALDKFKRTQRRAMMTLKACLQKGSQKKTLEELTIEHMLVEKRTRRERERDKERLKSLERDWERE
ncbi:hypothetical protein KY290_035841 [Solanum tuberosum]|uniref:Uncharacterized protein n=1 Tax=Solanum tuberosum TaxID=4113 RepID=A0ABQ7TRK4_SOLTU|nr:hypothetical protein KY290_035841 [Solanum tuberosum]